MMTDDDQLPRVEEMQEQVSEAEVSALAAQTPVFSQGRNRKPSEGAKEA